MHSFSEEHLIRYSRNILVDAIGGNGQEKLLKAKVLVIGAGGIGSPLLYYLAAAGVGTLGIIDDDKVELSNLQRQILHETNKVGAPKTDSAKEALSALNPDITIQLHETRLTRANAESIIKSYDIIADGCDNAETRFLVQEYCHLLRKPLISGAIRGFQGQIATFKAYEHPDYPCYGCLYTTLIPKEELISCTESGVLGAVAGVIGSMQATEVVKEILNIGQGLAGFLLLYDGLRAEWKKLRLKRDPACDLCNNVDMLCRE